MKDTIIATICLNKIVEYFFDRIKNCEQHVERTDKKMMSLQSKKFYNKIKYLRSSRLITYK